MKDSVIELAKLFKERENQAIQGVCIGEIIAVKPYKLLVNTFIIKKDRLVIAKHLIHEYVTAMESVGDHGSHSHKVSDIMKKGDKVIVIPDAEGSKYFVIDKVGDVDVS